MTYSSKVRNRETPLSGELTAIQAPFGNVKGWILAINDGESFRLVKANVLTSHGTGSVVGKTYTKSK